MYERLERLEKRIQELENKIDNLQPEKKKGLYKYPIFRYYVNVEGDYNSIFHFETKEDCIIWLDNDFTELKKIYRNLYNTGIGILDGLKIGDECFVAGEGDEVFKIKELEKITSNRWSFLLDKGWFEDVHKCSRAN